MNLAVLAAFRLPPGASLAAALLFAVLSAGGGYWHGLSVAGARAEAIAARLATKQARETAKLQQALDAATLRAATAERARQDQAKGIRDEVEQLKARPSYGAACIDADGVRLLERAAGLANGAP